jgi:predicted Zn-dependent peptidase
MNEFHKDTLANGLRVMTVEMPHLHCAEMVCYVGTGGRHEGAETAGISHFLEHMLFRGTTDHPSSILLERAFEAIGGAVNASTDLETTCFHSRLHPANLRQGAALFASMLRRPLLGDMETERKIILEEALEDINEKGEEINPDNLTARLLWPGTSLAFPTVGTRESIHHIGLEHLRRHHGAFYRPDNTVIAVAGPVTRGDVLAAVKAEFGGWPEQEPPQAPSPLPPFADQAPESVWVRDSGSQVSVQLAFRVPHRHSPHAVPLRVLRRILSWGASSRLMLSLRERLGLTYHVDAGLTLYDDCGCLTVDIALNPTNLVTAVRELLAIFEDLCEKPVNEEELGRTVQSYLYDLDFSRDHPDEMSVRYGWGELVGYLRTVQDDRRDITAVTPQDLFATSREFFTAQALKVAVVGPWRKKDRPAVEKLLAGFRRE